VDYRFGVIASGPQWLSAFVTPGLVLCIRVFGSSNFAVVGMQVMDSRDKPGHNGSVPEMSRASEDHGDAVVVGSFDHFVIAQ